MNVDLGVNLVGKVPNPSFVREVRVHLHVSVAHHGLVARVNLTKLNLVADVVFLLLGAGHVLLVHADDVVLVLFDCVGDHVLDKPVVGRDLLVNNSVLLKESVYNLPLVVDVDLVFTVRV